MSSSIAPGFAFAPNGHNIIEAQAYLSILRGQSRFQRPPYQLSALQGPEIINVLVQRNMLSGSTRWQGRNTMLSELPAVRSGDMDFILNRQFSTNGQAFHFMATPADIRQPNIVDPVLAVPPHMLYSALPRCLATLDQIFDRLVLTQWQLPLADPQLEQQRIRFQATPVADDLYALIHSVADSYSEAHVERDTLTGQIRFLKPWKLLTLKTSLDSRLQHNFSDAQDSDFFRQELPGEHEQQASDPNAEQALLAGCRRDLVALHPYQYSRQCLTPRADSAVSAVEDLLITTSMVLRGSLQGLPSQTPAWQAFKRRHLKQSSTLPPQSSRPLQLNTAVQPERSIAYQFGLTARYPLGVGVVASHDLIRFSLLSLGVHAGMTKYIKVRAYATEVGATMRIPLTETLSIKLLPLIWTVPWGGESARQANIANFQAGYQVDLHPPGTRLFVRFEPPRFSYANNYHFAFFQASLGYGVGTRPLWSPKVRRIWRPQERVPSNADLRTARVGNRSSLVFWLYHGSYNKRNVGSSTSYLTAAEWTRDRNRAGMRTGTGYGLAARAAINLLPANYRFMYLQAGPTLRIKSIVPLLLEPCTFSVAIPATTRLPENNVAGQYRRYNVFSTLSVPLALGDFEFVLDVARYSHGDNRFWQHRWLPVAGFRIGYVL